MRLGKAARTASPAQLGVAMTIRFPGTEPTFTLQTLHIGAAKMWSLAVMGAATRGLR